MGCIAYIAAVVWFDVTSCSSDRRAQSGSNKYLLCRAFRTSHPGKATSVLHLSLPGLKLASNGEACEGHELATPQSTRISAHVSFKAELITLVRYHNRPESTSRRRAVCLFVCLFASFHLCQCLALIRAHFCVVCNQPSQYAYLHERNGEDNMPAIVMSLKIADFLVRL
jgi:hypothetical protein